jgi:hypothetical protein
MGKPDTRTTRNPLRLAFRAFGLGALLQEGGASTFYRLRHTKHIADLRLIAFVITTCLAFSIGAAIVSTNFNYIEIIFALSIT